MLGDGVGRNPRPQTKNSDSSNNDNNNNNHNTDILCIVYVYVYIYIIQYNTYDIIDVIIVLYIRKLRIVGSSCLGGNSLRV